MKPDAKPKPSLLGAETAKVADLVSYQDGSIVSREIVKKPTGTVTVFAFDEGQGLICKIKGFHAAFFIGGSNFGEVAGGQCKRLLKKGFRLE